MIRTLSEKLKAMRTDRPDEWTMDELLRDASKLEKERDDAIEKLAAMESQRSAVTDAGVAFDIFVAGIGGLDSNAWHDYPADEVFHKGFEAGLAAAPSHSQQNAPRITERDAREVCDSYWEFCAGHVVAKDAAVRVGQWMKHSGSELLAKLNADRCPIHESEQTHLCTKCGWSGNQEVHEGCGYLASNIGNHEHEIEQPVDTSAWPSCNPACEPELGGHKDKHCNGDGL